MSPTPDPLDTALEALREVPPIHPSLRAEIRQRIFAEGPSADRHAGMAAGPEWWFRPWVTVALVAACMLAGILAAEYRIGRAEVARNRELAKEYLVLIDPLLHSVDPASPEISTLP